MGFRKKFAALVTPALFLHSSLAFAHEPRLRLEFRTERFGFQYDVYKDGRLYSMDSYGSQLAPLLEEVPQAASLARQLSRDRRSGMVMRTLGHVVLWPSILVTLGSIGGESSGSTTTLSALAGVGGFLMASVGKSKSRRAYRYLFRAVNVYNEDSPHIGSPGRSPDSDVEPETASPEDEGRFPPGNPDGAPP